MIISMLLIFYALFLSYLIGHQLWALVQTNLNWNTQTQWHASIYPIIGFTGISLFLGIYHLFFKIDYIPHLFFLSWLLSSYKQNWLLLQKGFDKDILILLLLVSFVAALAIVGRPGTGDIADYHLQGIKWAEWFANIPGLGNFNRPLANNNWWFNLQAFFGFSWLGVKSVYVGNAAFFICLFFWLVRSEPISRAHRWLRYMFILFWILTLKAAFIGAVTPDIVVTGTMFLLIDLFILISLSESHVQKGVWLMLILVSWILTVKATAISFGMLLLPFLFKWIKEKKWKELLLCLLPVLLFLIPWLVGNVIVSGYLLYPFHQIDLFSFDWKLPNDVLAWETFSIKNWGKVSGQDVYVTSQMSISQWLPIWFNKLDLINKLLVLFFVITSPLLWIGLNQKRELFWPALFVISGFTLFFLNGPHPRFLFGYMVGTLALFLYVYSHKVKIELPGFTWYALTVLMGIFLLWRNGSDGSLASGWFHPKPYPYMQASSINIDWFKAYETKQGSTCWDGFPCTYYKVEGIEMRGMEISEGFRIKPAP